MNQKIVRALVRDNDKTLLVQRNEKMGYNQWQLPGGHTDGQKHKTALKRELKEETNLNLKSAKFLKSFINPITKKETLVYNSKVKKPMKIKLQEEEVKDYGWFNKNDINKLELTPSTKRIFRE